MLNITSIWVKNIFVHRFFGGLFFLALIILPCRISIAADKPLVNAPAMALSLSDAIDRALHNNILVKLAREHVEEIRGVRTQSGSAFLPHVTVNASQSRTFWYNLAADGLPEAGVSGPFNSFNARLQIVQRVFDLSALSGFEGEGVNLEIARLEEGFAKQEVILSAVFAYLNVLDKEEKLRAVDEDINLAQQLAVMANHQLSAGVVTELDVIRAKTHLAQRQAYRQDILQSLHEAYFQLMRTTGLPLESDVALSDSFEFFDEELLPVEDAVDMAFQNRIEMSLAREKVRYQEYKLSEAKKERLPMIDIYGNYGEAGSTPGEFVHEVGAVGLEVTMPIFEGGNINGRIHEQRSLKRAQELRRDDIQVQVEEDVRLALQTMTTSTDRVKAAQEAFDLAKREVELAQNQYHAGMENNIAVVEAQAVLEHAHEVYITDAVLYHLGRVNYFSAMGKAGQFYLNPLADEEEKK